jgi:hypothetical protein
MDDKKKTSGLWVITWLDAKTTCLWLTFSSPPSMVSRCTHRHFNNWNARKKAERVTTDHLLLLLSDRRSTDDRCKQKKEKEKQRCVWTRAAAAAHTSFGRASLLV